MDSSIKKLKNLEKYLIYLKFEKLKEYNETHFHYIQECEELTYYVLKSKKFVYIVIINKYGFIKYRKIRKIDKEIYDRAFMIFNIDHCINYINTDLKQHILKLKIKYINNEN